VKGNLRGRRRGMGKFRGPRVNSMNLGSPWRETSKNWQKVMRLPDFGYSDVTRSKVRALLRAKVGNRTMDAGNGKDTNLQHPPNTRPKVAIHSATICARDNHQTRWMCSSTVKRGSTRRDCTKSGHMRSSEVECWSGSCSVSSTCRGGH
jgi:hypothetical protein